MKLQGRGVSQEHSPLPEGAPYLLAALGVQQNPSELDDLGRVLGHVHSVFITRRGNMYDHVTVQLGLLAGTVRHFWMSGRTSKGR